MRPYHVVKIVLFAASMPAALALAQDTVVITATRYPESRDELPVGVTVITADDLRRSPSSNLAEILAQFGLLHIRDNAGTPNAQLDLRGFGASGDANTLVLLDGVRISENEQQPAQLSRIPIESVERIEILRGAGAVPYGSGASGGTINVITRRAAAGESSAYLLGRAGGFGTRELRAGAARQGERLGIELAFSDEGTEGYRRNNRFTQTNLALTLQARGARGHGYFRANLDAQRLRLPGALTEAQMREDRRQTLTPDDWSRRSGSQWVAGGAWRHGNAEWSADLAWRERQAEAYFALFGGFYTDTRAGTWQFTPRVKWTLEGWGQSHEIVAGADFERWDYETLSAPAPGAAGAAFSRRRGRLDNVALHAQANARLGTATRVVLGARTQQYRDRLEERVFPLDERQADRRLSAYELAVRHALGGGWAGIGRLARSFRTANFDDNACFFPPCAPRLLDPQTADSGELALEYDQATIYARAAVYVMRLRDEIYFSPLVFANVNLAPTRRRGVELQGRWRVSPGIDLSASLAVLDASFRSGTYGGVDVSGKRVPLVPREIASAIASWRFAPRSRVNASLRWVGPQRYDNDQANRFGRQQPGYALAGLKVEHQVGGWALALEASNLFDRRYTSYGVWDFGSSFSAFPAPGRSVIGTLAWRMD